MGNQGEKPPRSALPDSCTMANCCIRFSFSFLNAISTHTLPGCLSHLHAAIAPAVAPAPKDLILFPGDVLVLLLASFLEHCPIIMATGNAPPPPAHLPSTYAAAYVVCFHSASRCSLLCSHLLRLPSIFLLPLALPPQIAFNSFSAITPGRRKSGGNYSTTHYHAYPARPNQIYPHTTKFSLLRVERGFALL